MVAWLYSPAHRPYGVLFSNLSAQDAASVIQKLNDDKVPYQLSDGGSTIRVPTDSLYAERVKLAGEGAIKGNGSGWELFDKTNLGMTTFQEQVMKLRATEGELQRTIEGLTPVQSARVNIAQPEAQLYTSAQQPTTASIAVTTKPGMTLLPSEVRGITELVAGAVPGLKPENVTIVDQDGNVLLPDKTAQNAGDAINMTSEQLVAKQRYEMSVQQSVQSMLDQTLGPLHAVARVNAQMNFDANSSETKQYAPQGVVRSEQSTRERYNGAPGGQPAGGVPGTTSNIPTYQGAQQTTTGNYSKSQTTRNYEITESTTHHIDAPGKVTKLSVAVLVNVPPTFAPAPGQNGATGTTAPSYAIAASDIAKIRNAVSAAAGIDPARGDTVTVEAIPFNPSVFNQPAAFAPTGVVLGLPRWALAALVILLLVGGGMAFRLMRDRQFVPTVGADLPTFDSTLAEELPPFEEHPMLEQAPGLAAPIRSAADLTREQMIEYVTTVAQENPDSVAKLIKLWLAE